MAIPKYHHALCVILKVKLPEKKDVLQFLVKTEVTGNMNHSAVLSSWKGSISIRYTLKTQS